MPLSADTLRLHFETIVRSHPLLRLVQHFCTRTIGTSSTSDLDFGLGGLLALLAIPGAFSSILLMDKYSSLLQFLRGIPHFNPYLSSLPDEYFFIVYSMAITGIITLLRWDQLLPDTRDFANLGALSLSLRKIFIANVIALATLAALFAIDINLVSTLVFPLLATLQVNSFAAHSEFLVAHTLATIGISTFTFLALLALQGLLMAALPDGVYRRVSLLLRTILLILLTGTLISVFLLPLPFLQMNYSSLRAASWWPPLWFLSLFESLVDPLKSRSALGASFACYALGAALALTICGFTLSYKRYFLTIPERQTGPSTLSASNWFPDILPLLRPLCRPGLESACFQFIWRTLIRSETHLLFAGLFTGVGLLLTLQALRLPSSSSAQAILVSPPTFALFSLGGIRFVFDFASAPNANWVFRLTAVTGASVIRSACRKLLLLAGILPLLLIWLPVALHQVGWLSAALYLLFHLLFIALLSELLVLKLNKIPFTCPLIPSRDRFLKIVVGLFLALVIVLPALARVEVSVITRPVTLLPFLALLAGSWIWLYHHGASDSHILLYQETRPAAFVLLNLSND